LDLANHGISTRTFTDSLGRQVSQAVNVDGSRMAEWRASYSRRLKFLALNLRLYSSLFYSRNVNYVNTYLSKNNNYTSRWVAGFSKFAPDKYRISLNTAFVYTYAVSSINKSQPTKYWTQHHEADLTLYLPQSFELNNSLDYNWRQKLDNFDKKNSTLLWNASAGKNFFKNQLSIRWQMNDILGQNAGVIRNSTANQTSESIVNVLGRYWMLTASWRMVRHSKLK
jgi:hypothetical protein